MTFYDHEILKTLKGGGIDALILKVSFANQYLISLFDDDFYTQADFDIVDGKTRSMLTALLKKAGYKNKGSRHFISDRGESFFFTKPSHTLGCNPSDKVLEAFKDNTFIFCTPTQALLVLMAKREDLNLEFLKNFLYRHPVNVKKLLQWQRHDRLPSLFGLSEKELQEICDLGLKKRKARELEPLDLEKLGH
jgi:hypothetical protein